MSAESLPPTSEVEEAHKKARETTRKATAALEKAVARVDSKKIKLPAPSPPKK